MTFCCNIRPIIHLYQYSRETVKHKLQTKHIICILCDGYIVIKDSFKTNYDDNKNVRT